LKVGFLFHFIFKGDFDISFIILLLFFGDFNDIYIL